MASTTGYELIQSIQVTPQSIAPGESVHVTVTLKNPNDETQFVFIDGVHGASQYIQFNGARGKRNITVVAGKGTDVVDHATVSVTVKSGTPVFPEMKLVPLGNFEYAVQLLKTDDSQSARSYTLGIGSEPKPAALSAKIPLTFIRSNAHHTNVDVSLKANGVSTEVRQTFAIINPASNSRLKGVAHTPNSVSIVATAANSIDVAVTNLETEAVHYSSQVLRALSEDETGQTDIAPSIETVDIDLQSGATTNYSVTLPGSFSDPSVFALSLHLEGTTQSGLYAVASEYFVLRRPQVGTAPVTDAKTVEALRAAQAQSPDPAHFSIEVDKLAENKPAQLGAPGPLPPGTFMRTQEKILNARKGDAILTPADDSMIGKLLTHINQHFSHCGVMLRDFDEIRHCPGSQGRATYFASKEGFGIQSDVLEYGWPGTVTQSIDDAFRMTTFVSPDDDPKNPGQKLTYDMQFFEWEIAGRIAHPAVVVKPRPGSDTPEIRQKLHNIAESAKTIDGYYLFYAYSKAEEALLGQNTVPPCPGKASEWAVGRVGLECSAFIWLSAKRAAMQLEGPDFYTHPQDLLPKDVAEGAAVGSIADGDPTVDGLFLYSRATRMAALTYLRDSMYNLAYAKVPGWIQWLLGHWVGTNFANQMCNAFAVNDCDAGIYIGDHWSDTGTGNTVSPDNTMWWHEPYGYHEYVERLPATYYFVPD